jgi:two-component system, OmpR family, phosphate regulon response regulator OmpR
VRRVTERVLVHAGFQVSGFATAVEAQRALAAGTFSMLLTDGIVPGGGVPELIQSFKAKYPDASVLICSGYGEEDLHLMGVAPGSYRFLHKPYPSHELVRTVRELMAQHAA